MKFRLLLLVALVFNGFVSMGQQIVNHHADFSSGVQNMWGPSFSPVSLDQTITLFDESWNVNFNTGSGGIFTIVGQSFGGALSGNFSGRIGSEIRIEGFTSGTVEVDYPVDIELNMPTDLTYDQGETVTVQTDYSLRADYDLKSLYPSAGEFFWDLFFQMGASASAQLCFFGCTTFPIIPSFNTGLQSFNLVTVSGNGVSTNGNLGVWFLGPGQLPPYVGGSNPDPAYPGTEPPVGGWPYAVPVETSPTTTPVPNFIPWQCYIGPGFPAEIPGGIGLSGEVTIPYVPDVPDDSTGRNLSSCNDSTYFNLNLEIFQLLGGILGNVPGPVGAFGIVIANLSGSQDLGIAEIEWNFFSASFDANITNNQCFDFTPKIYGKFEFPVAVDYSITDASGTTSPVQQSSIIELEIGEDLNYKFPCYFEEMNIVPTYSIDGVIRNHTYDVVSFDFLMSAFEFGFEVPAVTVVPGFTIPEICIPVPYPCPTWRRPFRWCTYTACTPAIVVPPVGFSGWSLSVGPLWETTIPIGSFSYDWFDQTWSLEGFQDTTFTAFTMSANKLTVNPLIVDVDCYGDNTGSVEASVSAVSDALPYSYNWTNGTTNSTGNSDIISNLEAGEYQVSITDGNGCQLFTGGTVNQPLPLNVSYVKTDKSCGGGALDGAIDVTVSGGASPYTYVWSDGSTTQDLTNIDIGTYSLTVTDANSCQDSITVTIEEPFVLNHSAIVTDINCNGGDDGAINVTTTGGTLPYTFAWSSGENTENISNIAAGSYTISIIDNNGCTSNGTYTINEPAQPLSLTYTLNDVTCFGGNDGEIDLTVTGGTLNYNYQWFSQQNGLMSFNGEDPTQLIADTYTVVVTDNNGCSATEIISINQPSAPITDSEIITDVNCFGDLTGQIDPQIVGGTPPYNYAWTGGLTTPTLNNVSAGSYTLILTDNNGCVETFEYVISQPDEPLNVQFTKQDVKCHGESTGSINTVVTGGTENYSFTWSNGETTQNINDLSAGSYTLTVIDELGCSENITVIIDEPMAPLALTSVTTDVLCHGGDDGNIDLTVLGGTTPYSYTWSNGSNVILSDTTQDLANLKADEYEVLVEDANGCIASLTAVINEPAAPITLTSSITDVDCFGVSSGAIDISVSGGTPNYTYAWSNGQTTEDLNAITSGNYTVTITDQNGCEKVESFFVKQPSSALVVTTFGKDVKCNGSSTGSIQSIVSGGTLPYTYNWSNGQTTNNISNLSAGSYSLTVTDGNGCTAFSGAVINQPAELVVDISITDPSCYGFSNGVINVDVSGGVQPYYFDWGNENSILLNNEGETIDNIATGEYFIRVTDENDCIFEEVVFVDEPEPFEYDYEIFDVTCFEGSDGEIELTLTGGTTPYTVDWSNGMTGPTIQGLETGNYIFTGVDDQGCTVRGDLFVDEPDQIQVSYDLETVSCIDQSDAAIFINTYGGTTPYTYVWSNDVFTQNNENLAPGFYELIVTDNNNCTNTFGFDIFMNNEECLGIPNTFTPNGDYYNDTWVIENIDLYPNSTVKIFNKWGNEIYSSEGTYEPWDGTHNGKALPAGVYYYIIILSNEEDNKYTGNLTIVR